MAYIVRRILIAVPLLLAVLLGTFLLLWLLPGDPTTALLGERWTPEAAQRLREAQGLNDPLPVQFGRYVADVTLRGDFGVDQNSRPVTRELGRRFTATIELAAAAMIIAILVGVSAGILSALKPRSWRDMITLTFALAGVSLPIFWLGLIAQRVFRPGGVLTDAFGFKGMPYGGRISEQYQWQIDQLADRAQMLGESSGLTGFHLIDAVFVFHDWQMFSDVLAHLALPALVLATVPAAVITRITRTAVGEQLTQDYTRTARAKGVGRARIIRKHVMRNAMIPIITSIGTLTGYLLGGAVLTEKVFSWPGLGNYMVDAIIRKDARPLQAAVLIVAICFIVINLLVDVSYALLDPRISAGGAARRTR